MNAKVAKKSLVSWYKSQRNRLSGASTADIDLMSSGTVAARSRRTRASATPVASPTTGRVRSRHNLRHHHHHHHTHRHRHNRNRRRDTTSTAVTDNQTPRRGQMSPILPPVYPYPYPYTYGYPTYPAPHSPPRPPHRHQRTTSLTPRGPRSPPRAPSYPMGFAPYQPPPPPAPPPGPVYVLQAPSSGSPDRTKGDKAKQPVSSCHRVHANANGSRFILPRRSRLRLEFTSQSHPSTTCRTCMILM
ncbi:hypothetical protein BD779DRAFT_316842 [Infundibulicybe gibba]|nr:hypothetical protein BD779DRAFT_316842 [Infundibulicybe gibba]